MRILLLTILCLYSAVAAALPEGFVYLSAVIPGIKQDIRYNTSHNFIGRRIQGYQASECILTRPAANALARVQTQLKKQSLGLLVYDCYRPQQAVDDFVAWSQDASDQKNKRDYYPHIDKPNLFREGYIAAKSGHTRGSTVDLTIINLKTGKPLRMGTHFDFLDPLSNPLNPQVTGQAKQSRLFLRRWMMKNGFTPLSTEWWHFTYADEPYPNTYFDFVVAKT